jgi:hypothetical protein
MGGITLLSIVYFLGYVYGLFVGSVIKFIYYIC